jgi:hypothetical protein
MRFLRPRSVIVFVCVLVACLASCGSQNGRGPTSAEAESESSSAERRRGGLPDVRSEVGALNEEKVDRVFEQTMGKLQRCLNEGAHRVEFIFGDVSFFVKIDAEGRLAHAHLEKSTIGDRETERCMLDVLKARSWPKPQGGDMGFARKSFGFDPPNDVRPPADLPEDYLDEVLSDSDFSGRVRACKNGSRGTFTATMYVDTDGSVLGVGVAPPDEDGESAVDCLVDAIKQATFPSPGSWPGKVSFAL